MRQQRAQYIVQASTPTHNSFLHAMCPAAPGRVMDFIETGKLPCDQVKFFVLDEAGARSAEQRLKSGTAWGVHSRQWPARNGCTVATLDWSPCWFTMRAAGFMAPRFFLTSSAGLWRCALLGSHAPALRCLPFTSPCADRLLDTGNQDVIMKMFRRFPKAGAGVSRLQVRRRPAGGCCRSAVVGLLGLRRRSADRTRGILGGASPVLMRGPWLSRPGDSAVLSRLSPAPQVLLFSATLHSPEVRALHALLVCLDVAPALLAGCGLCACPATALFSRKPCSTRQRQCRTCVFRLFSLRPTSPQPLSQPAACRRCGRWRARSARTPSSST